MARLSLRRDFFHLKIEDYQLQMKKIKKLDLLWKVLMNTLNY